MPRILNVIETAYRAAPAQPGEGVLSVAAALQNAGADVSVLLRGNAVNYIVRTNRPPGIGEDVEKLRDKGATVYAVREDARDRGLDPGRIVAGIEFISRADVADVIEKHDLIWYW